MAHLNKLLFFGWGLQLIRI